MDITPAYLKGRLDCLEVRLGQFQQQLGQAQQMVNQTMAQINAVQGAIVDTKEMMAYLNQKELDKVGSVKDDVIEVKSSEA